MAIPMKAVEMSARTAKALAKGGVIAEKPKDISKYAGGIEFDHLAEQYFFCSNALLLSTIYHIFGKEGCGKTTLVLDWLTRYFSNIGGQVTYINTENKWNDKLGKDIIGYTDEEEIPWTYVVAPTLEKAQTTLTNVIKDINLATFGKKADRTAASMCGIGLDSFRVASEETIKNVTATGAADRSFPAEALKWRAYLGVLVDMMARSPVTFFAINHQVDKANPTGYGGPVKDTGGGMAIKFYETYQIHVAKVETKETKSECYNQLCLSLTKNSNGSVKHKVYPRVYYKSTDRGDCAYVDWDYADAELLSSDRIPRSFLASKGICDVKVSTKPGLYSDAVNKLSCVTFQEIMAVIKADPSRYKALQDALEIHRYKTLDELWDNGWFYDARIAADED